MSTGSPSFLGFASPICWVGRRTIATAGYFGGIGILLASASGSFRGAALKSTSFRHEVVDELSWMFAMGLPLVGLIHVGLGSFLALQSYYGGTFVEGTGAVVGVGLIRNVAPLMACQVLAILIAARMTPEVRREFGQRDEPATPRVSILNRPGNELNVVTPSRPIEASRAVLVRLIAGAGAGTVMGLWGSAVGTIVGWSLSKSLMGVSTHSFFQMFWDMLWTRDIVGLFVKGSAFGLVSSLFACREGLRGRCDASLPEVASDACRAACLSTMAILVLNSAWFIALYHASAAFGPTLLKAPTR